MTGTNMQLQQVAEQLYTGNVGKAIAEMETYLAAYPQQQTTEKLKGIKTEYQLMEDYWRKGVVDPQLTQLYVKVWLTLSSRNSISTCCSDSTSCSAMWHHTIIRCRIQPSRVSIAG